MTSFRRNKLVPTPVGESDLALMTPWYAAGTLDLKWTRQIDMAASRDPDFANDLAAARAERAEVAAMGEALGRPSMRPVMALFAAINAEARPFAVNVTPLLTGQVRAPLPFDATVARGDQQKKISRWC